MPSFLPVLVIGAVAATLIVSMALSHYRTARTASLDWKELVAQLQPVYLKGLELVARDFLEPSPNQLKVQPDQLWELVGGWEGLKRMRQNAEIMLLLAACTQRWNFDEGVIVTERMRRDAQRLRRGVGHLELYLAPRLIQILPKRLRFCQPFEVHEVASAYYLMRQRLLALYQTSHAGLYPVLAASL
jgi:hypothetical protein